MSFFHLKKKIKHIACNLINDTLFYLSYVCNLMLCNLSDKMCGSK